MKRKKLSLNELIKENKEEIMKNNTELRKIEKRIDDKRMQAK